MIKPILASYSAAGLGSPANIPIAIPLPDGEITEITIFTGAVMSGGDATFNFWLNGVPLAAGAGRWIIVDGQRHFTQSGMTQATVEGDSLTVLLEEISGGTATAPFLIIIWHDDGVDFVDDTAYNASTWNGVVDTAPSKNAIRDKIEAMLTQTAADIAAAIAGLSWKQSVRVATTANGTLATAFANGQTVDGVTLATGNRILLKDQSSGAENGIYVVAASGAPTRATDADSGAELLNASVYVQEGTTNADTQWTCTTNATITIGSTSLTWAQFNSSSSISDTAYNATTWDGVTTVGPSKNAVRDKIEAIVALFPSGTIVGNSDAQSLSNKNLILTAAHAADDTFTGTTITGKNNSGGVTQWDIVYLNGSSAWVLADANGSGTYPARGIVTATAANGAATSVLVHGTVRNDAWNWTPGDPIYMDTTAGALSQTAPSGSGEKVQEVGFALDADRAFFHFNSAYVTLV